MSYQLPVGNPVDAWWCSIRSVIEPCIELLGQFPPAPNATTANELVPTVRRALDTIDDASYPPQAQQIRDYLLESLLYLGSSLREQATHGHQAPETSHNMAYHKYLMVSYFLLQRGIYEPTPDSYKKQKAS